VRSIHKILSLVAIFNILWSQYAFYDLYSFFKEIQSKSNDSIKELITHQEGGSKANKLRKESGLALIEGIHLLDAWLKSGKLDQIQAIFTTAKGFDHPEINALLQRVIEYFQDFRFGWIDLQEGPFLEFTSTA
jgi:hypothetical protein